MYKTVYRPGCFLILKANKHLPHVHYSHTLSLSLDVCPSAQTILVYPLITFVILHRFLLMKTCLLFQSIVIYLHFLHYSSQSLRKENTLKKSLNHVSAKLF